MVAMMTMARVYSGIPVPEIYAWHPEIDNPVRAPYILIEWVDGISPWRKWYTLPHKERTQLMEDLAFHHTNFAKPLPFRGIGDLYFANPFSEQDKDGPFNNASTYRLGPITPGSACSQERGVKRTWPQTTPESLREFWLERWQWEVDWITENFGSDCSTIIDTDIPPHNEYRLESFTIGELLDVTQALLTLIQRCTLPPSSQTQLYEPCFVATDYAFRNIVIDPETHKITTFLDWDDVYVTPFLLCSRYPDEMCHWDGSGDRWYKIGGFFFLPIDEEGEIEGDFVIDDMIAVSAEEVPPEEVLEESLPAVVSQHGLDSDGASALELPAESDEETQDSNGGQSHQIDEDTEAYNGPRRLKDALLRRQYEQMLITHDARYGIDGFWEMRKDPLKIQELIMKGWVHWMYKEEWLKERAAELALSSIETCKNINSN